MITTHHLYSQQRHRQKRTSRLCLCLYRATECTLLHDMGGDGQRDAACAITVHAILCECKQHQPTLLRAAYFASTSHSGK